MVDNLTIEQQKALALANARRRQAQATQQTPQPSIVQDAMQGVSEDLSRRPAQIRSIMQGEGGTSLPEQGFQLSAQGLGAAGDVLGNLVIEPAARLAGRTPIPFTDQTVGGALGNIGQAVSNIPLGQERTLGSVASDLTQQAMTAYGQFAQENPRLARNLEAAGVIGTTFSPAKLAQLGVKRSEDLIDLGSKLKEQSVKLIPDARNVSAQELKDAATRAYEVVDSLEAKIKPDLITNIRRDLDDKFTPKTEQQAAILRNITPEGQSQVQNVRKAVQDLEDIGEGLSLQDFAVLDKQITDILKDRGLQKDAGGFNAAGVAIKDIQEDLRSTLLNAGEELIEGSPEGFEAYKKARDLYSRQARLNDLEIAVETASLTRNPRTALQTYFRNLNKDIKKGKVKGYSDNERKLIKDAAEQGNMTPVLDLVGSKLTSIVSLGAGNIAGGTALRLGSEVAREAAEGSMLRRADDVAAEIARNALPPQRTRYYDPALGRTGQALGNIMQGSGQLGRSVFGIPRMQQLGTVNLLGNIEQQRQQQGVQ